jgi:hypothetical protein
MPRGLGDGLQDEQLRKRILALLHHGQWNGHAVAIDLAQATIDPVAIAADMNMREGPLKDYIGGSTKEQSWLLDSLGRVTNADWIFYKDEDYAGVDGEASDAPAAAEIVQIVTTRVFFDEDGKANSTKEVVTIQNAHKHLARQVANLSRASRRARPSGGAPPRAEDGPPRRRGRRRGRGPNGGATTPPPPAADTPPPPPPPMGDNTPPRRRGRRRGPNGGAAGA